ncbi:MAG: threonine/serine exporter family protein, partial [Planctomycetota bacterium]
EPSDRFQQAVDKLIRIDETLELVAAGTLLIADASRQLEEIDAASAPYPRWANVSAYAICCGAVAIFFQGSPAEILAALVLGLTISLLEFLPLHFDWDNGLLEPIAGFIASIGALAISRYVVPIDDRLVTLAALIVLIPGLRLTMALNELAVGHLAAGVSRLAGACVHLLTLTIGVAVGWRIAGAWRNIPEPVDWPTSQWWPWAAILVAPITFAIIFHAGWRQWPTIALVTIAGFTASSLGGTYLGIEVGATLGALAVGCGSNLYARIFNRPAMVPLTPGILILVPGSIGYRSLTAFLDNHTIAGIDLAFQMLIVAVGLVGGILIANVLIPPRRTL